MSNHFRPALLAAFVLVGIFLAGSPLLAQDVEPEPTTPPDSVKVNFYPSKFVCGFQSGNVPLLNDPNPVLNPYYEHAKPGNYATTFNILNMNLQNQTISFYTSLPDDPAVLRFLGSRQLRAFGTTQFGCPDVATGLGGLTGRFFEGYLLIVVPNDQFKVSGVYTLESQNAFERHILWRLRGDGSVGIEREITNHSLPDLLDPVGPIDVPGPYKDIAASGAGGLGLGASIDVEWMKLMCIDVPVDNHPMPIREDEIQPAADTR